MSARHSVWSRQSRTVFWSLETDFNVTDFTWRLPWCRWTKGGSSLPRRSSDHYFDYSGQPPCSIWEPEFCAQLNMELRAQKGTSIIKIGPFHTLCSLRKPLQADERTSAPLSFQRCSGALFAAKRFTSLNRIQISSVPTDWLKNQGSQDWFSELIAFLTALEISLNSSQVRSASWVGRRK